jgi:hypothetical protein
MPTFLRRFFSFTSQQFACISYVFHPCYSCKLNRTNNIAGKERLRNPSTTQSQSSLFFHYFLKPRFRQTDGILHQTAAKIICNNALLRSAPSFPLTPVPHNSLHVFHVPAHTNSLTPLHTAFRNAPYDMS